MSREDFNQSWLTEMPEGLGKFETFDALEYHINDLIKNNVVPENLGNNVEKIELSQTVYYWVRDKNGAIVLGVELEKTPQALIVMLTGKNPKYKGKPPYASDLYKFILDDNKHLSLRLMSDISLSDEGKAIWDRLFQSGLSVSIYDRDNPGRSFTSLNSKEEMDQYFKNDDANFKRYQYVISESGEMLAETRSFFHIRRFREQVKGML